MPGHTHFNSTPHSYLLTATAGLLLVITGCGSRNEPRRVDIEGVEYVYNQIHPLHGTPLPQPRAVQSFLLIEGGSENVPSWSAIKDVRASPGGGLAVVDMHLTDVTWFDRRGAAVVSMDLGVHPLRLTSPVGAALRDSGGGVCVDMALRKVISFDREGLLLGSFNFDFGLPVDIDLGIDDDIYLLTTSRPDLGEELLWQVRKYGMHGTALSIAGSDSLFIAQCPAEEAPDIPAVSLSTGSDGHVYISGLDYLIFQINPDGKKRVITRPTIESRIPDYELERRRRLMQRRIRSQQQEVAITEELAIIRVLALDGGGVLAQTTEWHPALLDENVNSSINIVLLDEFSDDGSFLVRHAIELPLPRTVIHLTDVDGRFICGYGVPSVGEAPVSVFSFQLPESDPIRR
jgi:hypothetical protein